MINLINEAHANGARLKSACSTIGISVRTLQRWQQCGPVGEDGRKAAGAIRTPKHKFSEQEQQTIIDTTNTAEFADKGPKQIVPILADRNEYVGSESTFYRVLHERGLIKHRQKSKPRKSSEPKRHEADGPNQIWTWDITYLPMNVKGLFFYLYLIIDIYSRKAVGWDVYETQSDDFASLVADKAVLREKQSPRILHSDNGSPMKGYTMLATLQRLGIKTSFSRPGVSNDNAFSESLFKTLKNVPFYPEGPFESLTDTRQWVQRFIAWYNEEHRHSAIKFVTPGQRHRGEDIEILAQRAELYERQKAKHPGRWSGKSRDWTPVGSVFLNPRKSSEEVKII